MAEHVTHIGTLICRGARTHIFASCLGTESESSGRGGVSPRKVPVGIPKNAIPPPQSSGPSEAYPVAVSVAVGGGIAWSCRASLLDLGRTAPPWSSYTHRCYNQDKRVLPATSFRTCASKIVRRLWPSRLQAQRWASMSIPHQSPSNEYMHQSALCNVCMYVCWRDSLLCHASGQCCDKPI